MRQGLRCGGAIYPGGTYDECGFHKSAESWRRECEARNAHIESEEKMLPYLDPTSAYYSPEADAEVRQMSRDEIIHGKKKGDSDDNDS